MHRTDRNSTRRSPLIFLCFVFTILLPWPAAQASDLTVSTSKPSYYRFEIVEISIAPDHQGDLQAGADTLWASVRHQDTLVQTVAALSQIPCLLSGDERRWVGYWPIPWNPPLGTYTLEVEAGGGDSSRTVRGRQAFAITGRPFRPIEQGFCAMNIESTIDFLRKPFPTPFDTPGTGESFLGWAEFLGADAILYSVGQTMEGQEGVTDDHPWYPLNVRLFPRAAALAKQAGFAFGGWIGCHFLWGEKLKALDYDYSWDYWKPTGKMYQPHRVSVGDEKRLSDIIALVAKLNADPNVDFVGLDYIRTGFGGYELAEDFVRKMSVRVPEKWSLLPQPDKRLWLALKIEEERDQAIVEKWRWYCAHRVASNVQRIIRQSGLKKPLWVFLLGWRHGQEHGQDPVMFYDAGASWCAVMLYESNADQCREMNRCWPSYIAKGTVNLIVGESVDWDLLQKSTDPPGPEEFYRRVVEAVDGFYDNGTVEGAFWHDLNRGAWGKRGPYRRIEWAVTGAAAFSYVRWKNHRLPLGVTIRGPEEVPESQPFTVSIRLMNSGPEDVQDVVVRAIDTPRVHCAGGDSVRVGTLRANTEASVFLHCSCVDDGAEWPLPAMVATRTAWAGDNPRDQFVSFAYVNVRSKKKLTD